MLKDDIYQNKIVPPIDKKSLKFGNEFSSLEQNAFHE